MLIEFSVGNYLSFKTVTKFSMLATNLSEFRDTNVAKTDKYDVLKCAAIYGANASGKSNLLKAMEKMKEIITMSTKRNSTDELAITPFLFSTETDNAPSFFEVVIMIDSMLYRYGFETTNTNITSEWLFETKKRTEKLLFMRENDIFEIKSGFKEGKGLEKKTLHNMPFIARVDQDNGEIAKKIIRWFDSKFKLVNSLDHKSYQMLTLVASRREEIEKMFKEFFVTLNLGFDDFSIKSANEGFGQLDENKMEKAIISHFRGDSRLDITTRHKKYNALNKHINDVDIDMETQESTGTYKIFNLSGRLISALRLGDVLIIDEFDASLHPLLTLEIIKLFNSVEANPGKGQLIFATHDTNLLSYGKLRRDQIYFVEKDEYGASDLYSLAEYKEEDGTTVRSDRSYGKDYIQGRYGAIPFIGGLHPVLK